MAATFYKVAPLLALFGVSMTACGGASSGIVSSSRRSSNASASTAASGRAATRGPVLDDGDEDGDAGNHYDDFRVRGYGHGTSASEERAIAGLVKRYYAAAAAGSGASACPLLYSGLAKSSKLANVAEVYAPAISAPPLSGKSCEYILSLLFREHHQQLAAASATLGVTSVRVAGGHGSALLAFATAPERWIPVEREGGAWRIDSLFDREIP